jgi:wyosine [tRNA(Phe)-imidazoG37] synthetase (radical SAM superfamily)
MFTKENEKEAEEIARIAKEIAPDEVQINTPLRPSQAKPLTKREMLAIKKHFTRVAARLKGLSTICVYESTKKKVKPISIEDIMKRRGEA